MRARSFTPAEVAFVLREPIKAVKKALDEGPVRPTIRRRSRGVVRAVEWRDLVYLYAVGCLKDELTPKARRDFYEALGDADVHTDDTVRFGRLSIAIGDLRAEVEERARALTELSNSVSFGSDGEAVLKGSGIPVHRIAALLDGGATVEEVCEDYPSLSPEDVETARAYASAHPKAGRPYPRVSVKRALRGAGLEALDAVLDDDA